MYGSVRCLLVAVLVVGLLLSGCLSGEEVDPAGDEEQQDAFADLALQEGEARLQGQVFNDGLEPVEGARVVVRETGANTTTGPDGEYTLEEVEPGAQRIIVEASGHEPIVEEMEVLSGAVTLKDFMLQRVRGADPYVELRQQVGLLECQVGLVVLLANCIPIQNVLNTIGTNPTNTVQIHKWDIEPTEGLRAIVLEMVWEPSGLTTAEEMVFLVESDGAGLGGGNWGSVQGPSVIRYVIDKETEVDDEKIFDDFMEAAENGEPYQTRVFPPNDLGNFVFQQKFEIFASHFYYSLPSDDYTAVPDDYAP